MKIELHFYHWQWEFEAMEQARVEVSTIKVPDTSYKTYICSHMVELPDVQLLSPKDKMQSLAAIYQQERQLLVADHVVALAKVDDKLQQLLAISCSEVQDD